MLQYVLLMVLCEILAAFSQVLLKKSSMESHVSAINEYLNLKVIAGYLLLIIAMLLVIFCYGKIGYMNVIIIEPLGYVFVLILSRFFFRERLQRRKMIGSALILMGICIFYS